MDRQEQGLREKTLKSENYQRLLETDGWRQLREYLKAVHTKAFQDFVNDVGPHPGVSRETLRMVRAIFEEIGLSFDSGEAASRDLDKLLKRNERNE